jgi:hypothetical protein
MAKKRLSNPFSTGGGGFHFEAHVQASFVALMLSGGRAPCLPCWPISEIKLQGKIDGIDTDDLIVVVENTTTKEQRRLLGQIKHSIAFTKGSALFGEVIQAAWNDFRNPHVFTRNKDSIALITGSLGTTDSHNVRWLLNQAKRTKNVDEFFRNTQQINFKAPKSEEKLEAIQHHLKIANDGEDVSSHELYDFLNHFHLLGYDLGNEVGVVLSLLHSHISQFQQEDPQWIWSRIVDFVHNWNQDAGTITRTKLPEDLTDAFKPRTVAEIPEGLMPIQEKPRSSWTQHQDATSLALAVLIGSWEEETDGDVEVVTEFLGIDYNEWLNKAPDILGQFDSPLSVKNGIWTYVRRPDFLSLLGSRILDQNLTKFKSLAVSVLKEADPAFELSADQRFYANILGKKLKYSYALRKGIAEGLAILASNPGVCPHCSHGYAENISRSVINELLTDTDWILWGSLNSLLPTLAEAAPGEFLTMVERALRQKPCPFDDLFSQEGKGIAGRNYLTGLLWALEGVAWDADYLVRTCVALSELASHDPGGSWGNRPSNSLATILLPWLPQTSASVEMRRVAVETILREQPEIGWNLIIQLLPGQKQTSMGSHKPIWRKTIPDDWDKRVSLDEYWQQASAYGKLAVDASGQDSYRLAILIDHLDDLPEVASDQLFQVLDSPAISGLAEEQRFFIWDHLTKTANKHRRFVDAKWALPVDVINRIHNIAEKLAPRNPIYLYQSLFSDSALDLYEDDGNWEEQEEKLNAQREKAISEIFQQDGVGGVLEFAKSVSAPCQVGLALGIIHEEGIETALLPDLLDSTDNTSKALIKGLIMRYYSLKGWEWCDGIDKSNWTPRQIGRFLTCLPFSKNTWDRATEWLHQNEHEYWSYASANVYQIESDPTVGIEKLIQHARPLAAINCLHKMDLRKQPIDSSQCVQALLSALSSSEPSQPMDRHHIVELIKYLQSNHEVNPDDLYRIEWAYIPVLDRYSGASPQLLESRLAHDPEFFCELIQLICPKNKEASSSINPEGEEEEDFIRTNAWQLLREWKTPPGTQQDGTFSEESFSCWLQKVKEACVESGYLEEALDHIGEVLIHAPQDPGGLWIHSAIASALNDPDAVEMRNGYWRGTYYARGIHWIDPTGEPERELAKTFHSKAVDVEAAGFQRLATTMRDLAEDYNRDAAQIINKYQKESQGK